MACFRTHSLTLSDSESSVASSAMTSNFCCSRKRVDRWLCKRREFFST
jgi:hypothetical protein